MSTNDVKRYEVLVEHPQCGHDTEHWGVRELSNGKYVLHTDYAALRQQLDDERGIKEAEKQILIDEIAAHTATKQQLEQAQGEINRGIEEYKAFANRFRDVLKCYEMPADRLPTIIQQHLDDTAYFKERAEQAEARVRELEQE